jgi:hypothetical protein
MVPGAQVPLLSALRPWPAQPEWDTAVWFDILSVPNTPTANDYYAELEQWIYTNYTGDYAGVRVEWSKGWGYTAAGAWTNAEVIGTRIPASFTQGMAADAGFRTAVDMLDRLDPHRVFSTPFLDRLMPRRADLNRDGVVDGAENNIPTYVTSRHFEVAKFYTQTEHSLSPEILAMSKRSFDKLAKPDQGIIRQAAKESVPHMRKLWFAMEDTAMKQAIEGGTQVVKANKKAYEALVQPVYDQFVKDAKLKALVERIRAAKAAAGDAGDNATDGAADDWTDEAQQRIWFLSSILA